MKHDINKNFFMNRALELARLGMNNNYGGPFGAVIVKSGKLIGEGYNTVTSSKDPTAHAEIIAIRKACMSLNNYDLSGCEIYCSCEPCPMCLGAIYWARIESIYFSATRKNAAMGGFDDELIYDELNLLPHQRKIKNTQLLPDQGKSLIEEWLNKSDRTVY